jgi:transcriptional regulator with XRE-family HTH domain
MRVRRLQLGMSLEDLARRMRVSIPMVHHYEMGSRRIWATMLWRAAKALRVPVPYFLPRMASSGDPAVEEDYAAAAEAMLLCPELEAIPRLSPTHLDAVRALIVALAPPLQ